MIYSMIYLARFIWKHRPHTTARKWRLNVRWYFCFSAQYRKVCAVGKCENNNKERSASKWIISPCTEHISSPLFFSLTTSNFRTMTRERTKSFFSLDSSASAAVAVAVTKWIVDVDMKALSSVWILIKNFVFGTLIFISSFVFLKFFFCSCLSLCCLKFKMNYWRV